MPAGVDVTIEGQSVSVKGPKGTLDLIVAEPIVVSRDDDGAIVVARPDDERRNRSLHGLSRTLVANLVTYSGLVVVIHCAYALFARRAKHWLTSERGGGAVNRAASATFVVFGATLAMAHR